MAYTINGKVYTEHPLMDEIVYNLDIIMNNIVVKDNKLAFRYETEESLEAAETYMSIQNGTFTFTTFQFTDEMLLAYGYNHDEVSSYMADKYQIPESDRDSLLEFCEQYYLDNYVELNNYYRSLMGLPWIPEDDAYNTYFVYIDETYITEDYDYIASMDLFDFDVPVHEFSEYQVQVLTATGVMDKLYEEYDSKYYKYLHYIGDQRIDLYTARVASNWDILYMPNVENLVSDRFEELYLINKTVMLHRYYTSAYKIRSEYYDEMMIILLLCQTYTDMICDIPEWYIRRDIFDIRSCKYFLESHGIEFFSVIPLKYQIRIVKNMNKLIRYKSTDTCFLDIVDLFSTDTITIHDYYLYKRRIINEEGSYATGKDPADEYELEFVKTPILETYDDYLKDAINRETYDMITYQDKWWDGQDDHDYVKGLHYEDNDYTIESTKYLDIENKINMKDYEFQMTYFVGLLLNPNLDLDDIEISVSTISSILTFPLSDLFMLLFCMTFAYDDLPLNIRYPENKQYGVKPDFDVYDWFDGGGPLLEKIIDLNGGPAEDQTYVYFADGGYPDSEEDSFDAEYDGGTPAMDWPEYTWDLDDIYDANGYDPDVRWNLRRNVNGGGILRIEYTEVNQETFYNWLSWRYPYLWMDLAERVNGFNLNADLGELAEIVGFRHSSFGFQRGYTLEELGVDGYVTATKISSIAQLVNLYTTNKEIYENLEDKILSAETRDEKVVFQFVFDYLFTTSYDVSRYTLSNGEVATTYDQILKERNYVLWKYYYDITSEADLTTRQEAIAADMADIIDTLQYYLDYDCLNYIFSAFTVYSANAILNYIYLLCNFFKSWKAQFIETYVTYDTSDEKSSNIAYSLDAINEHKDTYWKKNRVFHRDAFDVEIEFIIEEDGYKTAQKEYLDVYGHYEDDPLLDNEVNGMTAAEVTTLSLTDTDGGGVEFTSYIPYVMLNGGWIGAYHEIYDLDGGAPWEAQYYLNANGKYAKSPVELHNEELSYGANIDGGHPSWFMYRTGSFITRIVDNQIVQELRVAAADDDGNENSIIETSSGLYLPGPLTSEKIADYLSQMTTLYEQYQSYYDELESRLEIVTDSTSIQNKVVQVVESYVGPAVANYNDIINGETLAANKAYTDQKAEELLSYYQEICDNLLALAWSTY